MRKVSLFLVAVLTITLCACGNNKSAERKDIAVQSEYIRYDFQDLKDASQVIVKVKVLDELSEKNSFVEQDAEDSETVSAFYAKRKMEVEEVYDKNNVVKPGEQIEVIEDAAMSKECYYHGEDYEALQKGEEYVLFLNKENANGDYSIISANNGKVCVSELNDLNKLDKADYEIAVKTLVEYDSSLNSKEKKAIINSKIEKTEDEEKSKIILGAGTLTYSHKNNVTAVSVK